jgi:SAM-dependent methyltransferase
MSNDSTTRFGNRVEDYVKYRPDYPVAIVKFLEERYSLVKGSLIADIGAGTGISTELFLKEEYRVIAVEPNKEMREKSKELLGWYPAFGAQEGSAENTGLAADTVDAIIAGQAYHWFDVPKAKEEFLRILKPDGLVVLMWNERRVSSLFEKEYEELILKHAMDYVKIDHRNISAEDVAKFYSPQPMHLEVFDNKQVFDFMGAEGRLLSSSYMPAREDAGFDAMISDLRILFDKHQVDGKVTVGYDTKVYVGRL